MHQSGILLIDKPSGITSAACVDILKKRLGCKRIGHAGTLDPLATGLLVVLINHATRLAQFAEAGTKTYTGTILLGRRTSTDDIEGDTLSESNILPSEEEVQLVAKGFVGNCLQVPPKVSALKVQGRRAYELARRGEDVVLAARPITISAFELAWASKQATFRELMFHIVCSRGTYVRALARDLGDALGCGACVKTLRREASRPFEVRDACSLEEASAERIISWTELFPGAPVLTLDEKSALGMLSGNQRAIFDVTSSMRRSSEVDQAIYARQSDGTPLGLLVKSDRVWKIGVNIG